MYKKVTWIVVVLIASLLVSLAGCGGQPSGENGGTEEMPGEQAQEKIYIGVAGPLTGDSAVYGEGLRNGVLFAIEEINASGGVNGKMFEAVIEDDKGDPKEAANVAQKFAGDDRLFCVVGHVNSSCTLAGLPIYDEASLTVVSGSSTAMAITQQGYQKFFRTISHDYLQGPQMVKLAAQTLGHKKLAAIYANSDYGRGLMESVEASLATYGAELVASETYVPNVDKDFSPQITKIKAAGPDALLILGDYTEAGLIVRQMKTAGMEIDRIGAAGVQSQTFIELAGADAAEGTLILAYWDPFRPVPEVKAFVDAFKAKHGTIPDEREAYGYEIPFILKAAIEEGATKETLHEVLRGIEFTGATGYTKFDERGDVSEKDQAVLVVKDGQLASWVQ
ncbi:MAG: ABC transporter substrate-binding protein [Bacillota bacterium]